MNKTELILLELTKTKKYKNLSDELILPIIQKYEPQTDDMRTSEFKESLKLMKRELHKAYAVYFENKDKIKKLISSGGKEEEIMNLHSSTKERLVNYPQFYKEIFKFTGVPKRIADLGCGLNPLSYKYLGSKPHYLAVDVDPFSVQMVSQYFSNEGIDGEARVGSALDLKEDFRDYDIVFMFKLLTLLEMQKKDVTKELLPKIKSKYIVITFPTKSLGARKPLNSDRIRKMIPYQKLIKFSNEDVLIVKAP